MIVLSIYFHDMGLVVTEEEFKNRASSGFKEFCETKLFATPGGTDYRDKVEGLPFEQRERFLYQEFVRANHSRRVRCWIEGKPDLELGYAEAQMKEIGRLLNPLDADFRRDLGLVCESHNLDDIDNITKYRLAHPYGNSDDETVNLQYCSILLRTIDLLQITRNRTPSVLYRLVNPSDPISQVEWAKQAAVKRVREKTAVDREGNASADLQSDTVEIFATFTDDNAFFGLTSYLRYAAEQIATSYGVLQKSRRHISRHYAFPWRYVDDTNVEVDGFVKKPFGFEIDQDKILDLLTGHTLYNDSNVVIRELVQNAIDAVRLQAVVDCCDPLIFGKVNIFWNSATSDLTVTDNGTGMTQEIIERHLLKVGSSRYQDPKFREKYPAFSPISRFGIGVLSSFMVADSVEIVTVSPEEEQARQISLRSVHGKYLIRLLDKKSSPSAFSLGPHGTSIKIRFRSSARKFSVLDAVRTWILFPLCQIRVMVDDTAPAEIGYPSPKAALESYLLRTPYFRSINASDLKVEERTVDGITLAYVLRFSSHYRDWSFIGVPQTSHIGLEGSRFDFGGERPLIATCIEGVAVEFQTPGFGGSEILAVANAVGAGAPKTNVARSSIEATDEKEKLASTIYTILFDAVTSESMRLKEQEEYSLTWAVEQIPFIIAPALAQRGQVQYLNAHQAALEKVPMFLIESDDMRAAKSLSDLVSLSSFWTVDSILTRSVENFIREAKAEVTANRLLEVSQGTSSSLPVGSLLTNNHTSDILRVTIGTRFQVTHIVGNIAERRLDLKWGLGNDLWTSRDRFKEIALGSGNRETYGAIQFLSDRAHRQRSMNMLVPMQPIEVTGLSGYTFVNANFGLYLLPENPISKLFGQIQESDTDPMTRVMLSLVSAEAISSSIDFHSTVHSANVERFFRQLEGLIPIAWLTFRDPLIAAFTDGPLRVFNPLSWVQRDGKQESQSFWD